MSQKGKATLPCWMEAQSQESLISSSCPRTNPSLVQATSSLCFLSFSQPSPSTTDHGRRDRREKEERGDWDGVDAEEKPTSPSPSPPFLQAEKTALSPLTLTSPASSLHSKAAFSICSFQAEMGITRESTLFLPPHPGGETHASKQENVEKTRTSPCSRLYL